MKRFTLVQLLLVIAIFATVAVAAIAGTVGDRKVVTLAATTGVGTWTNPHEMASVTLKRISVVGNSNATNVVTASRIITESTGTYTQTVGAVTCSGSVGTQATLAYSTLLYGDTLSFSSQTATGGVVVIEYDVSQH